MTDFKSMGTPEFGPHGDKKVEGKLSRLWSLPGRIQVSPDSVGGPVTVSPSNDYLAGGVPAFGWRSDALNTLEFHHISAKSWVNTAFPPGELHQWASLVCTLHFHSQHSASRRRRGRANKFHNIRPNRHARDGIQNKVSAGAFHHHVGQGLRMARADRRLSV